MVNGPEDATFADVLNGLTMGAGRRKHPTTTPEPRQRPATPPPEALSEAIENAASVRAYAWTAGRTRSTGVLEIETLISATPNADTIRSEYQAIARICQQSRSVAEIGALLSLPIGVIRVLVDDMAGLGLVTVHRDETTGTGQPDIHVLQRVLRGLTNLRT